MKHEESQTKTIIIKGIERLDPVTVFLENWSEGQGRITIVCYGKSWTSFWGAMGSMTIEQFFSTSDVDYLAKNLSSISADVVDWGKVSKDLKEDVSETNHMFFYEQALEFYGSPPVLPTAMNPDYDYLCRIITSVKESLR
jgi:hypothetical protein